MDLSRSALQAAPALLGAVLTTRVDQTVVSVRVVEVEAYEGSIDPGSHAYRGRTARNEVMFGPPGHLYVYRHLGLHHCVNIVCGQPGSASAVLIRAGEVVAGEATAFARRRAGGVCRTAVDLARGPGRLTVALGLTREHNGTALGGPGRESGSGFGTASAAVAELHPPAATGPSLAEALAEGVIATGPRVGVNGPGGDGVAYPWRFWLAGDRHVSAFRPGRPAHPGGPGGPVREGTPGRAR